MNERTAAGHGRPRVLVPLFSLSLSFCLLLTGCRSARQTLNSTFQHPGTSRTMRAEFPDQRTQQAAGGVHHSAPVPDGGLNGTAPVDSAPVPPDDIPVVIFDDPVAAPDVAANPIPRIDMPQAAPEPPTTEAEALERLAELGAKISRDYEGLLLRVDLSFLRATDAHADMLTLLGDIRELDLTGTDITDDGLQSVAALRSLQSLRLKGTQITDAGLKTLSGMPELRLLDLGRTAVTDDGMAFVAQIESLNYLLLHNTSITDSGLNLVRTCRGLRGVNLIGTKVTRDGMDRFRDELPECILIAEDDLDVSDIRIPAEMQLAEQLQKSSINLHRDPRFRRLLALAQEQPELAEHLAGVYASRGEWRQAALILQIAEAAWPESQSIRYSLAKALVHAGELEEGLQRFQELLGEAEAQYTVGLIVYVDALRRAEAHLTRSLKADAGNQKTRMRLDEIRSRLKLIDQTSRQATEVASNSAPVIVPGTHDFRASGSSTSRSGGVRGIPVRSAGMQQVAPSPQVVYPTGWPAYVPHPGWGVPAWTPTAPE